jgi:hypothetical protein
MALRFCMSPPSFSKYLNTPSSLELGVEGLSWLKGCIQSSNPSVQLFLAMAKHLHCDNDYSRVHKRKTSLFSENERSKLSNKNIREHRRVELTSILDLWDIPYDPVDNQEDLHFKIRIMKGWLEMTDAELKRQCINMGNTPPEESNILHFLIRLTFRNIHQPRVPLAAPLSASGGATFQPATASPPQRPLASHVSTAPPQPPLASPSIAAPPQLPSGSHAVAVGAAAAKLLVTEVQRINSDLSNNCRGILGMVPGEGVLQASTKYRQLMKILHPDKRTEIAEALAGGKETCKRALERLQWAYDFIKLNNLPPAIVPTTPLYAEPMTAMPWGLPLLRHYSFGPIELKSFENVTFTPWSAGAKKARKTFITDSTIMHGICALAGFPEVGWNNVGIHIDGYLIARVLGKNAGCFAGGGDATARKALQGLKFKTVAVMPMARSLPPCQQARFVEHERLQAVHLSQFPALPALMDLEQLYKRIDSVGFYRLAKSHVRPESFEWLMVALCCVGAELNFVIGWNADNNGRRDSATDSEFRAQRQFLEDHLDTTY